MKKLTTLFGMACFFACSAFSGSCGTIFGEPPNQIAVTGGRLSDYTFVEIRTIPPGDFSNDRISIKPFDGGAKIVIYDEPRFATIAK